jgi:UDP-2-acetamido-2,6-beta-L-arabino-hexul-4-ose reductase
MNVLVTGAKGFIGRNLTLRLREEGHDILPIGSDSSDLTLMNMLQRADAVIHLAGANRPTDPRDYIRVNDCFSSRLCELLKAREVPTIYASSIQVSNNSTYGVTKKAGETHFEALASTCHHPINITRLANVFGKWCRPNYNSVVATFCHNIHREIPITIDDPDAVVRLVYIEDVINYWLKWLRNPGVGLQITSIAPEYQITLGALADLLFSYRNIRDTNSIGSTSEGFGRAMYSTFISYLPEEQFCYRLKRHDDPRGVFAEMLRTEKSGQLSFFTAGPGVTRGGHYHHTKTEKFLVVRGTARFRFRHMDSGEIKSLDVKAEDSLVVDSIPGWWHDVTNTGSDDLICILWANELFDPEHPDTIVSQAPSFRP